MKNYSPAILVLSALALSACGGSDGENQQVPAAGPAADKARDEVASLTKGMVSAVSTGEAGSGVDLKFDLKSLPQVGQPCKIDLAFLPRRHSETLRATFLAVPGLAIQPSTTPAEFGKVQASTVHRYELTVVPQQSGVFTVSAVVQIDTPAGPEVRIFAIPVLVAADGNGTHE